MRTMLFFILTSITFSVFSEPRFNCPKEISDDECKSNNKIKYCEYIDKQVPFLKRELQNGYDTYHHDKYREKIAKLTKDKAKYCN